MAVMHSATDPDTRHAYEANLRYYYIFQALAGLMLWSSIWVVYLQEQRGLTLGQVTAMEGPFWLATVLLEVPTGAVADRWGRKLSLSMGTLCNALAMAVFGIADSYFLIFGSYLAWAAALTFISGADSAFLYDTLKALGREAEFPKIHGRAWAISAVAMMGGAVVGAGLASVTTLATPILVTAALMVAAFAVSLRLKEPPRFDEGEAAIGYLPATGQAARLAWRRRLVRYMLIISAVTMATYTIINVLGQPYLREHGVGVGLLGLLFLPARLASVAGSLVAYRVVQVIGERRTIVLAPIFVVATALAYAVFDSAWVVVILPIGGMALAIGRTIYSAYLNDRIRSSQRATIMSFQQLLLSVVLAGLLPLSGVIGERVSLPAAYAISAAIVGVIIAAGLALWLRSDHHEEEASPPAAPLREPDTMPAG